VVEAPADDGRPAVDVVALVSSLRSVDRDAFERAVDDATG
jgi:hypothetical protein